MNRLTNFCASDLLSHILFYMETKDKFHCQEVLAQLKIIMLIVHVIVILADNGEKSVLVFRVHFFLKLKNQFMKMHLFHVHVRYVYYLLNQKIVISSVFLYPRLIAKMSSGVLLSGTAIWEKG